ncbi:MAG: ATP-binding protein [Alphaproteobacteria bacterium]|nr:MAG: ATP-binding protein [Alphaproteobacteria bacterium]
MIVGLDEPAFREKLKALLTPAQPISKPEHLHGRDKKLMLIDRALNSPGKHIFIFGDRGVGKTSLARTAAAIHAADEEGFAFIACDQGTTFFDMVEDIYRQLHRLYSLGKFKMDGIELSVPFLKIKANEAFGLPALRTINDAIETLKTIAPKDGVTPVVVIDEFDQLRSDTEKKYIADLIKQLSDQRINLRLIICGIGSSLDELIGVHLSTDRYLATIPLEPLPHDARWQILRTASDALGVTLDRNSEVRIGQLSDGFPYYVHLMGEQIFWQVLDDPKPIKSVSMEHYATGIRASIEEAQTSLKQAYEIATQKHKNSEDYEQVLWAVADGGILKRQVSEIYEKSYLPIMDQFEGRNPLPKNLFYQRLNRLKKATHGSIVIGSSTGWYGFKENVVRGYVRLRAERAGVEIGVDHILG